MLISFFFLQYQFSAPPTRALLQVQLEPTFIRGRHLIADSVSGPREADCVIPRPATSSALRRVEAAVVQEEIIIHRVVRSVSLLCLSGLSGTVSFDSASKYFVWSRNTQQYVKYR